MFKVRSFLSQHEAEKFVHAFISSQHYHSRNCNVLLKGISQKHLGQMQLLQNAAYTKKGKIVHVISVLR